MRIRCEINQVICVIITAYILRLLCVSENFYNAFYVSHKDAGTILKSCVSVSLKLQ